MDSLPSKFYQLHRSLSTNTFSTCQPAGLNICELSTRGMTPRMSTKKKYSMSKKNRKKKKKNENELQHHTMSWSSWSSWWYHICQYVFLDLYWCIVSSTTTILYLHTDHGPFFAPFFNHLQGTHPRVGQSYDPKSSSEGLSEISSSRGID